MKEIEVLREITEIVKETYPRKLEEYKKIEEIISGNIHGSKEWHVIYDSLELSNQDPTKFLNQLRERRDKIQDFFIKKVKQHIEILIIKYLFE